MVVRVEVAPALIEWSRRRSKLDPEDLVRRFPRLPEWEAGTVLPTLRQLERLAAATHTPVGFFFLAAPPEEGIPIPDYRTFADQPVGEPTADLLDTLYGCQERQDWFREYAQASRFEPVEFVGAASLRTPPERVAGQMTTDLGYAIDQRGPTWAEALRKLTAGAEGLGVLVMISGVVGSNTRRRLDPSEFRGFALVDSMAPVVFINGSDTRAAQIFTLAHEIAHLWLGQSALDDINLGVRSQSAAEDWCNRVAAEFLVPANQIEVEHDPGSPLTHELDRLARQFKVSTLVVLRRLFEVGHLDWDRYRAEYNAEVRRVMELMDDDPARGGGNFYNTQPVRVSRLFARSLITSALEGQTLFSDAFRMLGFKKMATFDELAQRLGVS